MNRSANLLASAATMASAVLADAIDHSAQVITQNITIPMDNVLGAKIVCPISNGEFPMADGIQNVISDLAIKAQIVHEKEMLCSNQIIACAKRYKANCRPHHIQECRKYKYAIVDDVIDCSRGYIRGAGETSMVDKLN